MNVIIDYGVGNIKSLMNWFEKGNITVVLSQDPEVIDKASLLILPGVGAFKEGMEQLKPFQGLVDNHVKKGKPLVGICLGMQLLFETSYEDGEQKGLNYIAGKIVPFKTSTLKIPHMGWQKLITKEEDYYTNKYVYFTHSYYLETEEDIIEAWCNYGVKVPGVVRKNNLLGFQFHPEKSGQFGETILERIMVFKNDCISSNRYL